MTMVSVLAFPGAPKPWVSSPEYCLMFPGSISDSSPSLSASSESSDESSLGLSSDNHSSICSSGPSPNPEVCSFHHVPSGQSQGLQEILSAMSSTHSLVPHVASSQDKVHSMTQRMESLYGAGYAQNVSPCMARPDLKSSLSNNDGSYCESYHGAFDDYYETTSTQRVNDHAGLVHPTPRNAHRVCNNLSFLYVTDDMPRLPLLEGPNEQPGHDISSHQNIHVSSMPSYNPGSSDVNLYAHKTHVNSHISQCKLTNSENGTPSGQWSTNRNSDMCYHHQITSDVPEDMTWPTTDLYDGPWPLEHHPYIHGRQNTASGITGHGLAMPNSCHTTIAVPHSPTAQQSCNSVSGPRQTIGQAQHQQTFSDYGYTSNCGAVYSDTEAGSFTQQPTSGPSLSNIHIHSGIAGSASPQSTSEDRAAIEASLHYSDARNVFLIDCKRRGLSYKDIKRMGGFKEAESTLRGRFRTLTKAKDQRVRKPKWQDKDIKLLCEAVLVCSESPEAYTSIVQLSMSMHQPPKVSWKKVAEYIWSHGGSYYFGNATCKKKWCEIHDIKL